METLRERDGCYDLEVVTALAEMREIELATQQVVEIEVRNVRPGMVLAEEIRTVTDMLLVARGQEISERLMERMLQKAGHTAIFSTNDWRRALDLYREVRPDLVLLDVHMPGVNGLELLSQLNEEIPDGDFVPIVVLTADVQSEVKVDALTRGARDFLTRPLELT